MSDGQQPEEAESVDDSDSPLTEQPTLPPQKASDASVDETTLPPRADGNVSGRDVDTVVSAAPPATDWENVFTQRIADRHLGWMDIRSKLLHFSLINYAVPIDRLRPHIPEDRFEITPFQIGGQTCGLLSVVPFLDDDFHYARLAPYPKFRFAQTNHRVYVIDRATGEHGVWFFGTTLGSWMVYCARTLWRIPWHYAKYDIDCHYDPDAGRYSRYRFDIKSNWCSGTAELKDTGESMPLLEGFESLEQQKLVLTHPVEGFFYRLNGSLGTYSVWHEEIPLTTATGRDLYFSLYETLGILSRDEMAQPHSVLLCPETLFEVHLPPRRVR